MARFRIKYLVLYAGILSCKHEVKYPIGNYPYEIGHIVVNKCATSGCHNNQSNSGAGGLNLSTWDDLFNGARSGAAVIPYRPDFSTFCYYTNVDTALGVKLEPTMPQGQAPLSLTEYLTITKWILDGAPDANGNIKFADNPQRKKVYVTNWLCDVVTVFDAETMLQMRYIDVGNKPNPEFANCVRVSPDKRNWYVSFFMKTDIIQKFDATNDHLVGEINLGPGSWVSFVISSDSRYGYFVDNSAVGKVVYADLQQMKVLATYTFNDRFKYPKGIVLNEAVQKLYVGAENGNFIYNIDIANPLSPVIKETPIDGTQTINYQTSLDPAELCADPTGYTCYIACNNSNEIRAMNMMTDKLMATTPLGTRPQSMSYSPLAKKLFVTCPDDSVAFAGNRGAVVAINAQTNAIVKKIKSGYQPYGIAADDERKIIAVANANLNNGGPAPHHVSRCGGRNGNVSFIDLTTLEVIPNKKSEVAVFPYSVSTR